MKNLYYIISFLTVFLFAACGGGSSEGDSSFSQDKINISTNCIANPSSTDIATYHSVESGDSIVQEKSGTIVSTFHSTDGDKKVCLNSGSAYIVKK